MLATHGLKITALNKNKPVTQGLYQTHREIIFLCHKIEHKPWRRETKLALDHKVKKTLMETYQQLQTI